jgi:hypothetical protein
MIMARTVAQISLLTVLSATMMVLIPASPAEAWSHARGNARASINRAPPAHAQRASHLGGGGFGGQGGGAHFNGGNRVNAPHGSNSNNRMGNHASFNNSHNTVNVDNHRDVHLDSDDHGHGHDDHHDSHHNDHHDDHYDDHHDHYDYDHYYHPVATAAAVTATAVVTAAVVGAIVRPAQLPSNCVQIVRSNIAYLQCGSAWYQPQYQGSEITYIVVNAP